MYITRDYNLIFKLHPKMKIHSAPSWAAEALEPLNVLFDTV